MKQNIKTNIWVMKNTFLTLVEDIEIIQFSIVMLFALQLISQFYGTSLYFNIAFIVKLGIIIT